MDDKVIKDTPFTMKKNIYLPLNTVLESTFTQYLVHLHNIKRQLSISQRETHRKHGYSERLLVGELHVGHAILREIKLITNGRKDKLDDHKELVLETKTPPELKLVACMLSDEGKHEEM